MAEILQNTGAKLWSLVDDHDELQSNVFDQLFGTGGKSDIRLIDEAIGKINESLNGYYFKIINNKLSICKDTESGTTSLPVSITDDNGHTALKVDGTTITIDSNGVIHGATIDSAFSLTSENAIQNKVVKAKFDEVDQKINANETTISSHKNDQNNPHNVTKSQLNLGNVEDKSSETIRSEITKENVTTALGYTPYTPNEVDNKFSTLETNIDWKEAVDTFADIATTYPNPNDGWTVNVKDTDYTYRYNGSEWVAISANAIPKSTDSVDGLLAKEDHAKYDDAVLKVHTHDNKSVLDGITSNKVTAWDTVNDKVDKVDGKGLSTNDYTTEEKNKLAGIAEGANKTIVDSALDASSENPVQNKIIAGEINTLKKSVSDGKTLVATAITDKGVETAADATFAVMANNISQIETGGGELHGATISVTTTESTLIGKTIKLSLNSTTVDTKTFDSNGACSFTDIQEPGTYSVYSTDGTDSNTITVDVTAENIINKTVISCEFYLTPDGGIVTPVDDVAILLKCAEIKDKSYTTMDELLADEQAIGDITMSENAMKYLARSTGFADAVCANETFMTLLGQSAYVDATVLNSDLWYQKCLDSQYYQLVFLDILKLSDLPVGALIQDDNTKYNDSVIVWKKMESNHTGDPANSTALITDKIITLKCFDAVEASNSDRNRRQYGNNRYLYANIRQWLNSRAAAGAWYSAQHSADAAPTNANVWDNYNEYDQEAGFLTNFSEKMYAALLTVTKRVAKNTVTDGGGYEDVADKIFLLSNTEVGLANENNVAEGSLYALFNTASERLAYPTAEAVSKSEYSDSNLAASKPWWWRLRTPYAGDSYGARRVNADGTPDHSGASGGDIGVRLACVVSSSLFVSKTPTSDGVYRIIW